MPVPPPTLPSATEPLVAAASASSTCSGRTCWPSMSLSRPSHVSPATGRAQFVAPSRPARVATWTSASRTVPTECVFVSPIAPLSSPDSRIHSRPVSSPLPLSVCDPAKTGSDQTLPSWGTMTVTPVRTGPLPTTSGPSPRMIVAWPTRTPATSVIAFQGPGWPSPMTIPRSRDRTLIGSG